jgi:serine/threonine protein kinase/tetratricopeptide (TPR) repeat protein
MSEETLFHQALAKSNPQDRAEFLDAACAGQPQLRAAVEALLAASEGPQFLNKPAISRPLEDAGPDETIVEGPGSMLGPYRLLERIGDGGFGVVYTAEQKHPIRRTVALKILKPGMDSRQVITRFEAERQALALMDHPNISKVFDGGMTGEPRASVLGGTPPAHAGGSPGRPYFVMELVRGVPITKYCDEHHLTPRQRMELFVPVCQAVQHAHQKGIIHRDLKPTNVLVALYDGRPVPKVIDFGVAKATGQQLTDRTLVTGFGSIVGTLEYMSPEQAEINQLDVDTRSDIYSLGVLLYELLAGSPPFTKQEFEKIGMLEMLRVIREKEPSKPSTKLSTADGLPSLAANRNTEPAKLTKLVRGELDWIVMKALEKDRNRRYETANGFAMDIQRYLADEPVLACPPSVGYRLRKLVRRNKGPVVAVAIVLLALLGGVVGTTIGLMEARRQRDSATAAEGLASRRLVEVEAEKQRADAERAITQATNDFLQKDLLEQAYAGNQMLANEALPLNPKMTVREALDRASKAIEGKFAGQPLVEAAIRLTLSDTYRRLGEHNLAIAHAQRALELREAQLPQDHAEVLVGKMRLARAYWISGRYKESINLMESVRELQERSLGPEDLATVSTLQNLAGVYGESGRFEDALGLAERVYAARIKLQSFEHPECLDAAAHLGRLYLRSRRVDDAIALLERVRDVQLKRGDPDEPETVYTLETLSICYSKVGRTKEAIAMLQQVHESRVRVLESDHPASLRAIGNLAHAYEDDGQIGEAISHYERVAEAQTRRLPPGHLDTLISLNNLAQAYRKAGRHADHVRTREQIVDIDEQRYGPDHGQTLAAHMRLGQAYEAAGNIERAITAYQRAAEGADRANLDLKFRLDYAALVSRAYEMQKKFDLAESQWRKSLDVAKSAAGAQSREFAAAEANLGRNLVLQGTSVDAEALLWDALTVLEAKQADDWLTFSTRSILGESLLRQKKFAEAEGPLLQGYEGMVQREAKIPSHEKGRRSEALERLVQLYEAWNKPAEAAKWRAELETLRNDAEKFMQQEAK